MEEGFWRGRRVLITGHTGFKGAWLTLLLMRKGALVCGYSLPPCNTGGGLYVESGIASRMESSIYADVRDATEVGRVVTSCAPEIVFHLAAQSLVLEGIRNPLHTLSTNVMGTANVLEAVHKSSSVKVVVNVTSDKCYGGPPPENGYREEDALVADDPYGASKACSELVTRAYEKLCCTKGVALATARAGNVIGGGDWNADRLLPDVMRAIAKGQEVEIRNPNAVRPWQFVLDPLLGYLLLAESLWFHVAGKGGAAKGGAWNFGPALSEHRSVTRVLQILSSHFGDALRWRVPQPESVGVENPQLLLDASKARSELGWKPKLTVEEAVQWSAEWYSHYQSSPNSISGFTEKQLELFLRAGFKNNLGHLRASLTASL